MFLLLRAASAPRDGLGWTWWFLTETFLGQGISVAVVVGLLSLALRPVRHQLVRLLRWASDLRIARASTIRARIERAVNEATAPAAREPWEPVAPTPEEIAEEEARRLHEARQEAKWVIAADRTERYRHTLRNYAAGEAREVSLADRVDSFAFLNTHRWSTVDQGQTVAFSGRVKDPEAFKVFGSTVTVTWEDDHGDIQKQDVIVERL